MKSSVSSCCNDLSMLNISKVEMPLEFVNFEDPVLWWSVSCIIFNPVYWNLVARYEYRTGNVSRLFTSPYRGCLVLAASITLLGLYRDKMFMNAISSQPAWPALMYNWVLLLGYTLIVLGSTFVWTSFWALGITGTFLGDYFGILMEKRVTGFPFNILENPMYVGTFMNFAGIALIYASQAGLFISIFVAIMYKIALTFEGPFTTAIYRKHASETKKNS